MVNIAPIQTKFICFINDDNFLSFICLDMLLTTNIAKAIDIDTNMNFLKITFINATPPINIGFNTADVIGHPISASNAISIGIITCIIPMVESIVLLQISNTSLNPISVSETIVINTMYVVI